MNAKVTVATRSARAQLARADAIADALSLEANRQRLSDVSRGTFGTTRSIRAAGPLTQYDIGSPFEKPNKRSIRRR
jgi:hypothetical protein